MNFSKPFELLEDQQKSRIRRVEAKIERTWQIWVTFLGFLVYEHFSKSIRVHLQRRWGCKDGWMMMCRIGWVISSLLIPIISIVKHYRNYQ
jgi:hypothetical protein